MRIISKFKDYYDGCQDPTSKVLYLRDQIELPLPVVLRDIPNSSPSADRFLEHTGWSAGAEVVIFGFCGQLYFGLREHYPLSPEYKGKPEYAYLWDSQEAVKSQRSPYFEDALHQWLQGWIQRRGEAVEAFHELRVPTFLITFDRSEWEWKLRTNPCLRDLGWMREFPTQQCYQELEMFVGGVLGVSRDIPGAQTDVEKVVAHGFDSRTSFRKESHQRKARK